MTTIYCRSIGLPVVLAWALLGAGACSSAATSTATQTSDIGSGTPFDIQIANDGDAAVDSDTSTGSDAAVDSNDISDSEDLVTTEIDSTIDASTPDSSPDMAGLCGSPGCACTTGGDCDNGFCIEVGGKLECASLCVTGCKAGFKCTQTTSSTGDVASLCTPIFGRLCEPCQADADCTSGLGGQDNRCVPYQAGSGSLIGHFCAAPCDNGDICPSGYACQDTKSVGGDQSKQCVKQDLLCDCDDRAKKLGLSTGCSNSNGAGTCTGARNCNSQGLSACDAPAAQVETCNTLDDNCNGQTDEGGGGLCDDAAPCTYDNCISGECQHPAKTGACDDASACTDGDLCSDGLCKGTALNCDDSNPCTADSCNPKAGCVNLASAGTCSDGDACTTADACKLGVCTGGPALVCDDGNPCTSDSCDSAQGCVATPTTANCDDGNACTSKDTCSAGTCAGIATILCDDGKLCTTDSCDTKGGCVATPNAVPCDDGDACTGGDACQASSCSSGPKLVCNDNNACTTDSCNPASGCLYVPAAGGCDDGSACTQGDTCKDGACSGNTVIDCNDGNACTADTCEGAKGCVHTNAGGACNDGNACTSNDICVAGGCAAGPATVCSDGNPCTDDSCEAAKGCIFANNSAACDDLSGCTSGDTCAAGACKPGTGCGKNAVCGPKAGGGEGCACATGYSGDGQNCAPICPAGCQACSSPSVCTVCAPGKFLLNGSCLDVCPGGSFGNSGNCSACPQTCATCSSATTCTSCPPGQNLQNGQCSSCTPKACGIGCGKMPNGCGGTMDCGACSNAKIEAGNGFTCNLLYNGTVQCWGLNTLGQLGDGSYVDRWQATWTDGTPAQVVGLSGIKQIAVGDAHACALLSDGTVQCWGSHGNGQLGDGTAASTTGRPFPVKVGGISTAIGITAGRTHSCAVLADGSARCWGNNGNGQLGDGTQAQRVAPVAVQNLAGAIAIGGGYSHTCALFANGSVHCWGDNSSGQLGDSTLTPHLTPAAVLNMVTAVSLHVASLGSYTCVRVQGDTAQCWGQNLSGQLGTNTVSPTKTPTPIASMAGVKYVDGGSSHTCAVLSDGTVKCWGLNAFGQLGDGTTTSHPLPTLAPTIAGAVDITTGQYHTCALFADASVQCWGQNQAGQLGNETTINSATPVIAVNLPCGGGGTSKTCAGCVPTTCQAQKATSGSIADGCGGTLLCGVDKPKIATGNGFSCILVGDGTVRCWGQNSLGQLGDGSQRVRYQPTTVDGAPAPVGGITNALAVVAGDSHACALLSTGKIRCWGSQSNGQLGTGAAADSAPHFDSVEVSGISTAVAVSAGRLHTCAALADGTLKCWGYNGSGQLGDGTTSQRVLPQGVAGISGAIDVQAGNAFSCALTQGGLVKCWGDASSGQLGSGSTASLVPRNVPGLTGAVALSTASLGQFSCALMADGTLQCWGLNSTGQLGDGSVTTRTLPVGVMSLKGATAIDTGYTHTCARISDGSLKCWGNNLFGQLGDTTTTTRTLPTLVSSSANVVQVSGGQYHTCVVLKDGSAQCWGQNNYGQLGNETSIQATGPVAVSNLPCGGGGTSNVCGCTPITCQAQGVTSGSIADGCGGTLLCGVAPTTLAGGNGFGCAIAGDTTVKCWGYNSKGQLGANGAANSATAVTVAGLSGALQLAAGNAHACAVLKDGTVWCWGSHAYGQLGTAAAVDAVGHAPNQVAGISTAVRISGGQYHTCAVLADGTAQCWGFNGTGQLGDGSILQRTAPVAVADLGGLVDIAAGYSMTCALKQTGLVKCWGDNSFGQMGNGNVAFATPMNVAMVTQAVSLAAGAEAQHSCAILSNGTARCWGVNNAGQLGDNSVATRNTAVAVSGIAGATAMATGYYHTCAVLTGGAAKCWGYNVNGQLGDTTATNHSLPTAVAALTGAIGVAGQMYATCFMVAGGGVKCVGYNGYGGLGDGTLVEKHAVVGVVGLP